MDGRDLLQGVLWQACLEDFSRYVARFPDAVQPRGSDDATGQLPLGFTGPLKPLRRGPVIRSKQDDMSSQAWRLIVVMLVGMVIHG